MKSQQASPNTLMSLFFLVDTNYFLLLGKWLSFIWVGLLPTFTYNYSAVLPIQQQCKGEIVVVNDWGNTTDQGCEEEISIECGESIDPSVNVNLNGFLSTHAAWEVRYDDQVVLPSRTTKSTQQIIRTWQATHRKNKELKQNCTQTIYVQDKTPPVAEQLAEAANITVSIHQEMALLTVLSFRPSFTDNCTPTDDIKVELISSEVVIDKTCPKQQTHIRQWVGIDAAGNVSAPYEQIIVAEDEECHQQSWANH